MLARRSPTADDNSGTEIRMGSVQGVRDLVRPHRVPQAVVDPREGRARRPGGPVREQAKRLHSALVQCLPSDLQLRVESKILRVLSGLGDHVLTHELEAALAGLIAALEAAGRAHTANALRVARDTLASSIGMLGGRVLTLTPLKLLDRLAAKEKPHGPAESH